MRRYTQFAALLAVGVMLFGTRPGWCQSRSSGTAEARPSDVAPRSAETSVDVLPRELREAIERDPLKAAGPVKKGIETWGARVTASAKDFEKHVAELDLRRIDHQKVAIAELKQMLVELDEAAEEILAGYGPYQTNFEMYTKAVAQAPATYTALAESFAKKAGEQEHQDIGGLYADFAETSRKLAKKFQLQHKDLIQQHADLEQKIRYVHHTQVLLRDVRGLFDVIPSTDDAEAIQIYVRRVNEYIDGFQKVIKAVQGTADKIATPPSSESPGKSDKRPAPGLGKSAPPAGPISPSEYRTRLANLKR